MLHRAVSDGSRRIHAGHDTFPLHYRPGQRGRRRTDAVLHPGLVRRSDRLRRHHDHRLRAQPSGLVDLPGHGLSPSIGDYTSADLVAALVTTLDRAGIDTVIPVALSHAGWPAIELRRRLGERVKGLVFIDWMVLGTPPGFSDALAGLQSPAWADVRAALHRMWTADLALPRLTTYVNSMADYGQEHWSRAGARSPRRSQTSPCRSLLWRRSSPAPPSTSMPSPPMSPIWRRRRRTPQSIPGSRCSASRPTATSHRSRSPEQWLT